MDRCVGARIRERRELLGVSLDGLADRLGCAAGLVQDYEVGRVRAGATTLMLLARIFGVDIGYFLRGLTDDTPPPAEVERHAPDKRVS